MGSEVDQILAFLGQHADQQFCSACLAFEFKLSFEGVDTALPAAGHEVALRESRAQCAICATSARHRARVESRPQSGGGRSPLPSRPSRPHLLSRLHRSPPRVEHRHGTEGRVGRAKDVGRPCRRRAVLAMRAGAARRRPRRRWRLAKIVAPRWRRRRRPSWRSVSSRRASIAVRPVGRTATSDRGG